MDDRPLRSTASQNVSRRAMEATTSREDVAEASVGVSVGRSASTHGARGRETTTPSRSVTMDDDDDEEGDDDGGDARAEGRGS